MSDNIFARIARGDITVEAIYEDDRVIAFRDIAPQAPVHALVIPRASVENLLGLDPADPALPGAVLLACAEVARLLGVDQSGFRVVFNNGNDAGQTVPHLHAHVLGGRSLTWPPG